MLYQITNRGIELQAKVQAGMVLQFTKVEASAAYVNNPLTQVELADVKQELQLDSVSVTDDMMSIEIILSNLEIVEDYTLKQIGIYAVDQETQEEILYIIGQDYRGEQVPAISFGEIEYVFVVNTKISNADKIVFDTNINDFLRKKTFTDFVENQYKSHINSFANPHKVTKEQVGLSNVPNVLTNDQVPTYSIAGGRENIVSGEKISTVFGKIQKWFADLKTVAFTGSYNDLSNKPSIDTFGGATKVHTHTKSHITDFPTALKNPTSLTVSLNGTAQGSYDGSVAKNINIAACTKDDILVTGRASKKMYSLQMKVNINADGTTYVMLTVFKTGRVLTLGVEIKIVTNPSAAGTWIISERAAQYGAYSSFFVHPTNSRFDYLDRQILFSSVRGITIFWETFQLLLLGDAPKNSGIAWGDIGGITPHLRGIDSASMGLGTVQTGASVQRFMPDIILGRSIGFSGAIAGLSNIRLMFGKDDGFLNADYNEVNSILGTNLTQGLYNFNAKISHSTAGGTFYGQTTFISPYEGYYKG